MSALRLVMAHNLEVNARDIADMAFEAGDIWTAELGYDLAGDYEKLEECRKIRAELNI